MWVEGTQKGLFMSTKNVKVNLSDHSRPFLRYLERWYDALPNVPLHEVIGDTPHEVAVISVDMINGFCKEGPLSGPRVNALSEPIATFLEQAHNAGVHAMALAQDSHDPNTPEFQAYPPHCIANTPESQTIEEIGRLPFADELTIIPKNSLSMSIGTPFTDWMERHWEVKRFILVGDCTDLCVYHAAMYLRMHANAHNLERRVIVPAALVDTYEVTVSMAQEAGIKAHDGDLHHVMFLHHMALNGVEVVARLVS
jgi:nicotinamidase-related amidase